MLLLRSYKINGGALQDVHLQLHWPEGQPQLAPQLQVHPGAKNDRNVSILTILVRV